MTGLLTGAVETPSSKVGFDGDPGHFDPICELAIRHGHRNIEDQTSFWMSSSAIRGGHEEGSGGGSTFPDLCNQCNSDSAAGLYTVSLLHLLYKPATDSICVRVCSVWTKAPPSAWLWSRGWGAQLPSPVEGEGKRSAGNKAACLSA
eukprot:359311-Chlamydomonas_euryale.AAC.2